jgi:glycosyltransferase involved in cell wall biosynthesis
MSNIKISGFIPDLVIAHPGWGESLFVKDIFPNTKLLSFIEFHYQSNADAFFDPEFSKANDDELMRLRVKNANNLLALDTTDAGLCPTAWQHSTIPQNYQDKVKVIFDGIDTDIVKPNNDAELTIKLPNDREIKLTKNDEVVTFISRNLEPYRGYHSFIRALPSIMKERTNAKIIIVGGNDASYGPKAPKGQTWQQIFLEEVKSEIDLDRVIFLGTLPYQIYLTLLQITSVHVYLTYPFVLSWSCAEAMSAGAVVVGSKTPPVEEFIKTDKNGLLVDFFNYKEISAAVCKVLSNPKKYATLGKNARKTIVESYDLKTICLPKQLEYIESLVLGKPGAR